MAKISRITGTITLTDGTTSEFSIETDGGWQQWAAEPGRLGRTVDAMEALTRALFEDNLLASDDDDDYDVEDCDECGEPIPVGESSEVNSHHAEACSLFGADR